MPIAGIIFALTSAIIWGASDFYGGVAARRSHSYQVLALASAMGFLTLALLAFLWKEELPTWVDLAWAGAAGVAGALGIATLYAGLARGQAALVSPTAAVIGATFPALAGALLQGAPGVSQMIGFLLGIGGIGLVSWSPSAGAVGRRGGLGLALVAGLGFGAFFVCIAQVTPGAVFAPLAAAKAVSLATALLVLKARQIPAPCPTGNPIALLAGFLDVGGNVFFVLAEQVGRLDVAAVLSSMYPAGTVLLARWVSHEKVSPGQWMGVLFCLAAVALIAS